MPRGSGFETRRQACIGSCYAGGAGSGAQIVGCPIICMRNEPVTRDEWKSLHQMPKSCATISVSRHFSATEVEKIKLGFRPADMDDKWIIFFEKDRLYIHRSWTGYCIYIVRFDRGGEDYVACEVQANRCSDQYKSSDDSYDVQMAFWVIDFILLRRLDARMP